MKKLRDIELKKQQAAILKEQDKERRREHMVIIRQLENKKRNEERKKKIEDLKVRKYIFFFWCKTFCISNALLTLENMKREPLQKK